MNGLEGGPGEGAWTVEVDGQMLTSNRDSGSFTFEGGASGTIHTEDQDIQFENIEKISWT